MNMEKLDKEHLEPCMAEIYKEAIGPKPGVCPQSYEMWDRYDIWVYDTGCEGKPVTLPPFELFYIDPGKSKSIVDKYTKGLRGSWYYTPKLSPDEPGYEEHIKELYDFRDFEAEISKDRSLTYAQRAAKIRKEALAHNFIRRNRDAEYVSFNIHAGPSPSCSKEKVERLWRIYNIVEELFESGEVTVVYKDYVHANEFPYVLRDGVTVTVRKTMDGKYPRYTCYDDDGTAIDTLWNGVNIVRDMSARSMEVQISELKPHVLQKMKEAGYDQDEINTLSKDYADSDLKHVATLYLMTKKYHADNRG